MSHSLGALKFKDGSIQYYEYDGTADIVISHHYKTSQEVSANWRNHINKECACGKEEPVMLYTSYGYGYYIEGYACKKCKSVRSDKLDFDCIEPNEIEEDWAIELLSFMDNPR